MICAKHGTRSQTRHLAWGSAAYTTAAAHIRRLARRAAIPAADRITPHSLRHTFVTERLAAGVPLQDVQDAAGHCAPAATTAPDTTSTATDLRPGYSSPTQKPVARRRRVVVANRYVR
ncbi:MAG: site-specific integrase [Jatrophihabitans sp.]